MTVSKKKCICGGIESVWMDRFEKEEEIDIRYLPKNIV